MRFEKGQAVEMTAKARKMFPSAEPRGVVVSILGDDAIRVVRRGIAQRETWHPSFWKRAAVTQTVGQEQK